MAKLQGKKLLLIDDSQEISLLVRRIAENVGLKFYWQEGVDGALSSFESQLPDLIFLDLNMPDKDGFEFLLIRAQSDKLAGIPCIVFSGKKDIASREKAFSYGATDYLEKPLVSSLFLQKVRKYMPDGENKATHVFNKAEQPKIQARVQGTLKSMSEARVILSLPFKPSQDQQLRIHSHMLKKAELENLKINLLSKMAISSGNGMFMIQGMLLGVGESVAQKIRRLIKNWK